jgi:hypothetical protein
MRQNGNGTLTLEDARTWIEETGLCLFLPRRQFSSSVAPSFVEAVAGRRDPTPNPAQIAAAEELLVRLELDGVAVRLNLLGQPGEQPDFVVAGWVLPYVYALRGDRDWRRNPQLTGSRQVSPLAVQAYKLLEASETTVTDLTHKLGREVTEAAVVRAITELWQQLRIIPIIDAPGKAARWQLLRIRFQKAIAEGASTSQVTAISVLASIYLQAVIAATMEEVEIFLSPLTARSKVREVLRGLVATRQVHTISLGHAPHFYVAGTLPEFPAATLYSGAALPSSAYFLNREEEDDLPSPVIHHPVRHDSEAIFAAPPAAFAPVAPAAPSAPVFTRPEVVEVEELPEAEEEIAEAVPAPAVKTLPKPQPKPQPKPVAAKPAAHRPAPVPARPAHQPAARSDARPSADTRSASTSHGGSRPAAQGSSRPAAHGSRPAAHGSRPAASGSRSAAPARSGSKSPSRPAGKPQWSGKPAAAGPAKSKDGSARPLNGLRPKSSGSTAGSGKPAPAWSKSRPAARPAGKPAARSGSGTAPRSAAKPAARPVAARNARPAPKNTGGKRTAPSRPSSRPTQGNKKRG